ncbi:hypothetical protein [Seonamhaeicola sp.]|uniref:hypothetical protein n=1 Tax=Seonamhaeicola sp. TaxID=1912245 RepID=UPI002608CADA|nr:hypothetical protein [Seonamhaeicola sp.]
MYYRKVIKITCLFFFSCIGLSQEIGANFNHNAEIIDFRYLEKAEVEWVRTTPRILDYVDGVLNIENDTALKKVIEAGEYGYKVAFGYRWDFKKRNKRIPDPNSDEEKLYFKYAEKMLSKVARYIKVFKLGNEPNLETLKEDLYENEEGVVPLIRFTERLMTHVVDPYFKKAGLERPDMYVGSFPRLFMKTEQQIPGVIQMIEFAQKSDEITGLAVHLHISDTAQIDESFKFVRNIMPDKPIIVPEFSLFRLYNTKLNNLIAANKSGKAFLKKYNYDPNLKVYEYFTHTNTNGVSQQEWEDFFGTQAWYPQHNLKIYYDKFKKYGVVLATYPLLQQSCPKTMTPNSPTWFINPIFCQFTLKLQPNGDIASNPLHFQDFLDIVREGKTRKQK